MRSAESVETIEQEVTPPTELPRDRLSLCWLSRLHTSDESAASGTLGGEGASMSAAGSFSPLPSLASPLAR